MKPLKRSHEFFLMEAMFMLSTTHSKYFVMFILLICLFFLGTPVLKAEQVTTTTSPTSVTTTTPAPVSSTSTTQVKEVRVVEHDDSSIVGNFFRFVGNVIAFPFRMVGKALDAIF
jgi:hypothetical protein